MKKPLTSSLVLALGITLGYSQGGIVLATTQALVSTNNGVVSGPVVGTGNYYFEVLDMTQNQYASLTGDQQTELSWLFTGNLSLWTDSGVGGISTSLHAGGIAGAALAAGNAAANWAAPTPNQTYSTAGQYDYYIIVGWSASEGTNWSTFVSEIQTGSIPDSTGYFGSTSVAYNYAGVLGGTPGPVNLWGSPATGLAGSGGLTGLVLVPLAIPEPASVALVALGGASLLLFRRNKK